MAHHAADPLRSGPLRYTAFTSERRLTPRMATASPQPRCRRQLALCCCPAGWLSCDGADSSAKRACIRGRRRCGPPGPRRRCPTLSRPPPCMCSRCTAPCIGPCLTRSPYSSDPATPAGDVGEAFKHFISRRLYLGSYAVVAVSQSWGVWACVTHAWACSRLGRVYAQAIGM